MTFRSRISLASAVLAVTTPGVLAQETTRVSLAAGHPIQEANGASIDAAISGDGRFIAFISRAGNLLPTPISPVGTDQVYVHDRLTGSNTLVSVNTGGSGGNGDSGRPSISGDGRFIAFSSVASDLVAGDLLGQRDVFVRDLLLGTTTRLSEGLSGEADGDSDHPTVSASGSHVAFQSRATNLVADDGVVTLDIFVCDLGTLAVERVSVNNAGDGGDGDSSVADLSADGSLVVFASLAENLDGGAPGSEEDVFLRDRNAQTTELLSRRFDGAPCQFGSTGPTISDDGRYVCFYSLDQFVVQAPADTHGSWDAFVHDRMADTTELVSLTHDGDLRAAGNLWHAAIAPGGRHVSFVSDAPDFVAAPDTNGVSDVFLRDLDAGTTERVSEDSWGDQADDMSDIDRPDLDATGSLVVYVSWAADLITCDTNGVTDVYLRDRHKQAGWVDLGHALAGTHGLPTCSGSGTLLGGSTVTVSLGNALEFTTAHLVVGALRLDAPFKAGVLVPFPHFVVPVPTFASGTIDAEFTWPAGVPCGISAYFQWWIEDPVGPVGFAASNGLSATAP